MWEKIKKWLQEKELALATACLRHILSSGILLTLALIVFMVIHYRQVFMRKLVDKARALFQAQSERDQKEKSSEDELNKQADALVKEANELKTDKDVNDDWYKNAKS